MNEKNKRTIEYWKKRSERREFNAQSVSTEMVVQIKRAYDVAISNIDKEINAAVRQCRVAAGITDDEMKTTVELEKLKKALNEKIPGSEPYYARLTRLESLQEIIKKECSKLSGLEYELTTQRYIDALTDGYYRSLFDLQKGLQLGFHVNALPRKVINRVISSEWAGRNYSKSVWKNNAILVDKLNNEILGAILSGASLSTVCNKFVDMAQKFETDINAAKFAAERLIRTETNYFCNQGELLSYAEADIEEYQYLATLDTRTSELCQDLDGEHFPVKDAVVGKNYPPMHAFCRSTTVAWFGKEVLESIERRARDPVTGELYTVPADMNYNEWKEQFVNENASVSAVGKGSNGDKYAYIIPTDNKVDILSISDSLNPNKNIFNTADGASNTIIISRKNLENIYPDLNENEISYVMAAHKTVLEHGLKNDTEMFLAFDKSSGKIALQKIGSKDEVKFKTSELTKAAKDSIIFVHNHPSGAAFSPADFNTLNALESMKYMGIQGHSGEIYSLSVSEGVRFNGDIQDRLEKQFEAILNKNGRTNNTMHEINLNFSAKYDWRYAWK